eukprot:scaffold26910_cov34-Tisochrysis_lutea.AAC.7
MGSIGHRRGCREGFGSAGHSAPSMPSGMAGRWQGDGWFLRPHSRGGVERGRGGRAVVPPHAHGPWLN